MNHQTKFQNNTNSACLFSQNMAPILVGLMPAFRDRQTGEVHLSREEDGKLASVHTFFHLPTEWIIDTACNGESLSLLTTVEAGYWRSTGFIPIAKRIMLPLDS